MNHVSALVLVGAFVIALLALRACIEEAQAHDKACYSDYVTWCG